MEISRNLSDRIRELNPLITPHALNILERAFEAKGKSSFDDRRFCGEFYSLYDALGRWNTTLQPTKEELRDLCRPYAVALYTDPDSQYKSLSTAQGALTRVLNNAMFVDLMGNALLQDCAPYTL